MRAERKLRTYAHEAYAEGEKESVRERTGGATSETVCLLSPQMAGVGPPSSSCRAAPGRAASAPFL
jgi:hypothetical protein